MRNKRISVLLLVPVLAISAALWGCQSGKSELAGDNLISVDDTEFRTAVAAIGDLNEEITLDGELYSNGQQSIYSKYNGVLFKEYCVKAKDVVKKGDIIAKVEAPAGDSREEKQKSLEAKQRELSNMVSYYDTNIAQLNAKVGSASGRERTIAQYELEKMQLEQEYIIQNCKDQIAQIEKELAEGQQLPQDVNIYAEFDGQIDSITSIAENTVLDTERAIGTMHDNSTVLIKTKYPGTLYYGEKVTVYSGTGSQQQQIEGTVVSSDNILQEEQSSGTVYIRLEGDYDKSSLTSLKVKGSGYAIKQVLTIPEYAVTENKGQYYVYVQEDGQLKRRHIMVGGSDGTNVWVLQGLSEGETVSVQ